jgi:hypothetical protein
MIEIQVLCHGEPRAVPVCWKENQTMGPRIYYHLRWQNFV